MKQLFSAFIIGIIVCFIAVKSCDDKLKQVNVKEIKKEIKTSGKLAETVNHEYEKVQMGVRIGIVVMLLALIHLKIRTNLG